MSRNQAMLQRIRDGEIKHLLVQRCRICAAPPEKRIISKGCSARASCGKVDTGFPLKRRDLTITESKQPDFNLTLLALESGPTPNPLIEYSVALAYQICSKARF